ncbi:hypothetical protein N7G274_008965 [Stereocaulon virgatum]|uniref:Uncharacterized protein n=1 Tax=Stereocaulon virgatum TaxID=373712 RepID=A0ABR4A027_9LECA
MSYLIVFIGLLVTHCLGQHGQYLQMCYDPNGAANPDLIPCNPDARTSACCGSGYICDTVLDCIDANTGVQYVPGCTDPTFSDYACPYPLNATYTNDPSNPPYDQYLNITICADGTACPIDLPLCCDTNNAISIISFDNTATVPSASASYSAYYAAAASSVYAIPTGSAYFVASQPSTSSSQVAHRTLVSVAVNSVANAGASSPTFDLTSGATAPIITNKPSLASKATSGSSSPTVASQTRSGGSRCENGVSLAIGALALSAVRWLLS